MDHHAYRILIILLILGILLGLIYLIYVITREEKCPNCGTPRQFLQAPKFDASGNSPSGTATSSVNDVTCPNCGTPNLPSAKFCVKCGSELKKD